MVLSLCSESYDGSPPETIVTNRLTPECTTCAKGKECVNGQCEWKGLTKCEGDADCMFGATGEINCKLAVERLARYDHDWTSWNRFPLVRWKDKERGIIEAAGTNIKFQNGFGAYQKHVYACTYHLSTDATQVEARPY